MRRSWAYPTEVGIRLDGSEASDSHRFVPVLPVKGRSRYFDMTNGAVTLSDEANGVIQA